MPISTTHINLTDVERLCNKAGLSKDHPFRYLFAQLAEQAIAQEQLINELLGKQMQFAEYFATNISAMKIMKQQMDRIEKRYDNTDLVSYDEPSGD